MWLSQASVSTGLDLSTAIWALAGVVTAVSTQLMLVWRERTKSSEERASSSIAALLKAKEDEIAYLRSKLSESEARNRYLEDDRAETKDEMASVVSWLKGRTQPPRKDSPPPGTLQLLPDTGYSISTTNPTKTRR